MAIAVNRSFNQDIDGILWGYRWDDNNFTYSFPTGISGYTGYTQINGFEAFNAAQQTAVNRALANIASFANVTFTQVSASTPAELRFAEATSYNSNDGRGLHAPGNNSAEANPPDPGLPAYQQGDTWYSHSYYDAPSLGSFAFSSGIMHETGHALGLKHGHAAQSAHGVTFPALPEGHNSLEYSVMTYHQFVGDTAPGDNAPEHPTTYMQDDIAALQYMYGANFNCLNGNTTYSWSATTGQQFINGVGQGQPISNFILMTVWDGGGVDTYDFTNYTTNLSVDLNPGGWTITSWDQLADLGADTGGVEHYARGNIANAQLYQGNTASLIENALGGAGNDTFTLNGYNSNNLIDGNGGTDRVIIPYVYGQGYTVSGTLANLLLTGGEGTDTFQDIEYFQFVGGDIHTAAELLAGGGGGGGSAMPDGDFDRDGFSDALWRNAGTGDWGWMDSNAGNAWHGGPTYPTAYAIVGTGDFNHDGYSDVMWRNNATGNFGYADVRAGTWNDQGASGAAFAIAGVGDFNRDGYSDVVWRNGTTGAWGVGDIRNHTYTEIGTYLTSFQIAGVGDFNHDGTSDVLWRNNTSGSWGYTDMQSRQWRDLGASSTAALIAGVGDFNNDGYSDVLWRNPTTGAMTYTNVRNNTQGDLGAWSTAYAVADVSDFNHDGYSDIALRNNATGAWGYVNGSTHGWVDQGTSSTAWSIVST